MILVIISASVSRCLASSICINVLQFSQNRLAGKLVPKVEQFVALENRYMLIGLDNEAFLFKRDPDERNSRDCWFHFYK